MSVRGMNESMIGVSGEGVNVTCVNSVRGCTSVIKGMNVRGENVNVREVKVIHVEGDNMTCEGGGDKNIMVVESSEEAWRKVVKRA